MANKPKPTFLWLYEIGQLFVAWGRQNIELASLQCHVAASVNVECSHAHSRERGKVRLTLVTRI
jgi:hypothetical protein